jgi:hypothetical protein
MINYLLIIKKFFEDFIEQLSNIEYEFCLISRNNKLLAKAVTEIVFAEAVY